MNEEDARMWVVCDNEEVVEDDGVVGAEWEFIKLRNRGEW